MVININLDINCIFHVNTPNYMFNMYITRKLFYDKNMYKKNHINFILNIVIFTINKNAGIENIFVQKWICYFQI